MLSIKSFKTHVPLTVYFSRGGHQWARGQSGVYDQQGKKVLVNHLQQFCINLVS